MHHTSQLTFNALTYSDRHKMGKKNSIDAPLTKSICKYAACMSVWSYILTLWAVALQSDLLINWEVQSEWEGSRYSLNRVEMHIVCAFLVAYALSGLLICSIGVHGIENGIPSRIYRDFSILSFLITTSVAVLSSFAALGPAARVNACDFLSREPTFLHSDAANIGLSVENCDQWFESRAWIFVGCCIVFIIVRLYFLLTLCKYHADVEEKNNQSALPSYTTYSSLPRGRLDGFSHIYVLSPSSRQQFTKYGGHQFKHEEDGTQIYAPITVDASHREELCTHAVEVWVLFTHANPPCVQHGHRDTVHDATMYASEPKTPEVTAEAGLTSTV